MRFGIRVASSYLVLISTIIAAYPSSLLLEACQPGGEEVEPLNEEQEAIPRDQPSIHRLLYWNGKVIAEGDHFFEIDLENNRARVFFDPVWGRIVSLASHAPRGALALCERSHELCLFSVNADNFELIELPDAVSNFEDCPILVADQRRIILASQNTCYQWRDNQWSSFRGWSRKDLNRAMGPKYKSWRWPPDHFHYADGILYLGLDAGEFGGYLLSFDSRNGKWSNLQASWPSNVGQHEPVNSIRYDRSGGLWIVTGLAHLGLREGNLLLKKGAEWKTIARATFPVRKNVNWPPIECDFRSLAFDREERPYILSDSCGVFRLDERQWRKLTQSWPGHIYCRDLLVLSDGRIVIATYDAGILVYEPNGATFKRITMGSWKSRRP